MALSDLSEFEYSSRFYVNTRPQIGILLGGLSQRKNFQDEVGNNSAIYRNKPLCLVSHPQIHSACANLQLNALYLIKVAFCFEKSEFGDVDRVQKDWLCISQTRSSFGVLLISKP